MLVLVVGCPVPVTAALFPQSPYRLNYPLGSVKRRPRHHQFCNRLAFSRIWLDKVAPAPPGIRRKALRWLTATGHSRIMRNLSPSPSDNVGAVSSPLARCLPRCRSGRHRLGASTARRGPGQRRGDHRFRAEAAHHLRHPQRRHAGDSPISSSGWRSQLLRQMIDERLQIQNSKGLGVSPTEAEFSQRVAEIERSAGMQRGQFKQYLQSIGVPYEIAAQQIEAGIAWAKIVRRTRAAAGRRLRRRDRRRAVPASASTSARPSRASPRSSSRSTRPTRPTRPSAAPTASSSSSSRGAPSAPLAQQFSQGATAQHGGDLGWILPGSLDPALDARDREGPAAPGSIGADPHARRLPYPLRHRPPALRLVAARRRAPQPGADDARRCRSTPRRTRWRAPPADAQKAMVGVRTMQRPACPGAASSRAPPRATSRACVSAISPPTARCTRRFPSSQPAAPPDRSASPKACRSSRCAARRAPAACRPAT